MPSVLIIDDDPAIRDGLRRLLAQSGYDAVAADSGVRGLEIVRRQALDVVVTDLAMPGLSGLELIRLVQGLDPTLPVVVLTGDGSLEAAVAAMRHGGAFDFLQKPVLDRGRFELAIAQAVVHRERLRALLGQQVSPEREAAESQLASLTERERELLGLLAQGLDNERIAETTCLTPKTIRNYLSALYAKLGVDNRTQAVLLLAQAER